jgi:HPt (histidine-containing phosphotransfer) domain-containing protein
MEESDPSIDLAQLAQIDQLETFRSGAREKLITLFDTSCAQHIPALQAALEQGSAETARQLSHSLKGVASALGATRLSKLFERLERLAGEGDLTACGALLPRAVAEHDSARAALQRWLDGSGAVA